MSNPQIHGARTYLFSTVRSRKSVNAVVKKLKDAGRDSVWIKDEWRYRVFCTKPFPRMFGETKITFSGML